MRTPLVALLAMVSTSSLLVPATAAAVDADCERTRTPELINGTLVYSTFVSCNGDTGADAEASADVVVATTIGTGLCIGTAVQFGVQISDYCGAADEKPIMTPGMLAAALRRLPIPPSELMIQPPNGRTLVNFDTNFYARTRDLTLAAAILGERVQFRVSPVAFTWQFGDGATSTTSSPGAPYPDLDVTHSYSSADQVQARVDTTYGAVWRVGGGPWRPVPGTVAITGAPVALEVREARPVLVASE